MKIQFQNEWVTIFESSLYRTTTTFVHTPEFLLLVDPNWLPRELDFIKTQLEQRKGDTDLYLLFTHSDFDHIIGYGAFPEARTIASRSFIDNPDKEKICREIRDFDDKYYLRRDYSPAYPTIDIAVETSPYTLSLGHHNIRFFNAPGHTPDSLIALVEPAGILIAGDYLSNVEFPFIYDSWTNYRATLSLLESIIGSHNIQLLITGHGDCTTRIEEMRDRIEKSKFYLEKLKETAMGNTIVELDNFIAAYPFPQGLKKSHTANLEITRSEFC